MTQMDKNALDIATEALRPLFREPVSYLESAAEKCIAPYFAALPPPAGDQQICDRLAQIRREHAEAERERDEARERASVYRTVLEAAGYQNIETIKDIMNAQELGAFVASMTIGIKSNLASATARAERLETALREVREWIDNWSPSFVEDDEWPATADRMNAALSPTPAKGARDA